MKIIKTKAPIDVEHLQEYFSSENILFEIMYYDSDIKGRTFLNYVSNLDINFTLNFYQTSQEEKYELLELYMKSSSLVNCEELEKGLLHIVLSYNNCNIDDLYSYALLNKENTQKFIDEFKIDLLNITDFIESLPITTLSFVPALSDFVNSELKNYDVVEDETILGKNVINLIKNPFIFQLYEKQGSRKRYFKHYSEEYIYDDKNLYAFMVEHDVPLLVITSGVASGHVLPSK